MDIRAARENFRRSPLALAQVSRKSLLKFRYNGGIPHFLFVFFFFSLFSYILASKQSNNLIATGVMGTRRSLTLWKKGNFLSLSEELWPQRAREKLFLLLCVSVLLSLDPRHRHSPKKYIKQQGRGFPGGAVVESLPANAGDTGSSPGLGRSHMPRSN